MPMISHCSFSDGAGSNSIIAHLNVVGVSRNSAECPDQLNGDRWGADGGRLYVTCLSLYVLEVYYRHLPLYRSGIAGQGF
jgi:hypothetical protein